jgi:TPR repeat protein
MPAKAMDGENEGFSNWPGLFVAPQHGKKLGPHILGYLDDHSLGRAAQVSHGWKQVVDQAQHNRLDFEKQALYALILELTGAEPNEVQRAHDRCEHYLRVKQESGVQGATKTAIKKIEANKTATNEAETKQSELETNKAQEGETDLLAMLVALKPRFLQPESLIRANDALLKNLLLANDLSSDHLALKPLVTLIKDLKNILALGANEPKVQDILLPLKDSYEAYLNKLLSPSCDRLAHLHPKALLSGEGFLGNTQGFRSHRLSQEMARSLLSKDEYGLSAKTNTQGSHAVCFKRSQANPTRGVHFKGNTANTGLPVGRESAVYALSQILFGTCGRTSASSLLCLNEVEIKTPLEGTDVNKAFVDALRDGKTSEEFFAHFPLYEKEFTQKDPSHVLQASLHVEGLSLEDFIDGVDKGKYTYNQIDLPSFSEHLFLSMLTNPTDGTPGNFMLRKFEGKGSNSAETFSIVGIDNDMALEVGDTYVENVQSPFVPGQKITTQQKHCVRTKNILMCLPLMNQPLSPATVKRILALNPELLALQWFERLKEQNIRYEQLQGATYIASSLKQAPEPYVSQAHVSDLHLPFLLDPDFIPRFCQTIRQTQIYLADHSASTHWQLLLNIHPLAGRFYQEMVTQAQGSVLGAYLKIDPPKSDPGKPRKDVVYLEDVLSLDEKLLNGQTVGQALKDVTTRADGTQKFTQTIDEAAGHLLRETDLFQQPALSPFLRPALESFEELMQGKSEPIPATLSASRPNLTTHLHPSWFKDTLLQKAISEKLSLTHLKRLLELGLDVTVMDKERRTTLRYVLDQGGDPELTSSLLLLLKSFCSADQLISWVNTIASDRLTALDIALEKRQISAFKELMTYGVFICHPNIALKFYKNVIKTTKDTSLKGSFLKLMNLNDEVRWHVCLEEMLPPYNPKANQEGTPLFTAKFGERLLPESIKDQILDHNNQWKPYTQEGNHLVCRATHFNKTLNSEHSLYFKVYPELPGIEEAVGLLTRKLLNYGAPHTELINIGGCPVLLSHSHGDKNKTLDYMLRHHPNLLKNLDEESLSGLILVAMLINPEDGKPTNHVLEHHPANLKKYRIVGIDNDHAFVPAIVTEKPKKELFSQKLVPIAQVKTILYCLDQMKDPVHPNIQSLFINLRPDELLDEWLRELKKVNTSYSDLFPTPQDHTTFFREHQSFLGVPFQKGAISHLYNKFVTIRDILTKTPHISHLDLLSKLEKRLAKRYQLAAPLPSPKERWEAVDVPFYEKAKNNSGTTLTRSGDILKSMDIPLKESVLESIRLGKGLGPIQALEELNTSKEILQIKILEALGARAGDLNLLKTLQLESTRAKFLEKIDFATLLLHEQEAILNHLKNKQLRELTLKNCQILGDYPTGLPIDLLGNNLPAVFLKDFSLNYLAKCDLRGCEYISCSGILMLSERALGLQELNLSNIRNLEMILDDRSPWIYSPIIFRELLFLSLSNCTGLSELLIQAPKLHYLNIENCFLLNDQTLDGIVRESKNLKTLRLKGAAKISGISYREEHPTFTLLATTLNLDEQANQGYKYLFGNGVAQDAQEAFKWYFNAALQGHAGAQLGLGWMYKSGQGVPQDDKEAIKWHKEAAEQNHPLAFYSIACLQNKGVKSAKIQEASHVLYQKAFKLFTETEEHKRSYAQNTLGIMYHCRRGVEKDFRQAFEWYQKAADQDYGPGQANLGRMYKEGLGTERNMKLALFWINKSVEQDSAQGFYHFALMYRDGEGVERDDKRAIILLEKAVKEKHPEAFYTLGWMIEHGRGAEIDLAKAQTYYDAGMQRHAEDALYSIGRIYEYGLGGEPINLLEAKKWYRKAADVHYEPGFEKIKSLEGNLGWIYPNDQGLPQYGKVAVRCYQKAADQGDATAQRNLGFMYGNGLGVSQDYAEALKWYQKAADQGDGLAQRNLGLMYANGLGVSQDYTEALKWYQKAADQGDGLAQRNLGFMYANGLGVSQDYTEALKWYQKAADQGDGLAQRNLGTLIGEITYYGRDKEM